MDLSFSPRELAFREEVRDFIRAELPAEVAAKMQAGTELSKADYVAWQRKLNARGWLAPNWPVQYGGTAWSVVEKHIFDEEMALGGAPRQIPFGVSMVAPVIIEFGSEEQKQRYLPRILSSEDWWCQGYSEPEAGSDLASLKTRADRDGDHYVINGQKTWITLAQFANMIFVLARTDQAAKKQEGISFILVDMTTPGVETRPIKLISGESPFCETFFTDVKIPKENLIGRLNGGWEIAKRLLQYERQNISGGFGEGGGVGGSAGDLVSIAKRYAGEGEGGALADPDLRGRITRNKMDFQSFSLTLARLNAESRAGNGPSAATSIIKYAAAAFAQERSELMVEAMGAQGLGWEGEPFSAAELTAVHGWLRAKANSIEGGTSEVNLNVIAKRVLGLPDPK